MDIFGTVAAAISLAAKIKATFDQIGYNKSDGAVLCKDIAKSLSRVDEHLKQLSTSRLHDDLSEYENELRSIFSHLERLTKQNLEGSWKRSATKLKQAYNAGDIKHELLQLRQKVQTCEQNLQRSCTLMVLRNQEAMQNQLQMLVDTLIPSSSPERMATLEQIEDALPDHISVIDADGTLAQELERIRSMNTSQAALSTQTARYSLRSIASSFYERGYLRSRVRALAHTLPQLHSRVVKEGTFTWFGDPFESVWESDTLLKRSREDAIRETLRILAILRSSENISYLNAAKDLLSLGRALGDLGMHEEAGVINDWGVQIWCELITVQAGNPKKLFKLAIFLCKLFVDLSSRQQTGNAQKVLEQVVEALVQLKAQDQDYYLARLAFSLHSSAISLHEKGMHEDTVKIDQEAVNIRRDLAKRDRETYLPPLAVSLHNLGVFLHASGRYEDAIENHREAVEIRRELVKTSRDLYLPDLTKSLHTLATYLHKAGQYRDSVETHQEAITNCQELVKTDRNAYLPELARYLHSMEITLHKVQRYEDAVEIDHGAVAAYRELAEGNRYTYSPDLALALYRLAVSLHEAGRHEDAIKIDQEAVTIRRELVEKDRETYLPDLALSLYGWGVSLNRVCLYEDAVRVKQEAVGLHRELVERNRDVYLPNLALSLRSLAVSHHRAGRSEAALTTSQEAINIRRELVQKDRRTYLPLLALSLGHLAIYLRSVNRDDEAMLVQREVESIHQETAGMIET